MAEKERVALHDSIDYTKMLTELSVGSSYIFALEQLMMYHIIRLDNPGDSPLIFAKFEKYIKGEVDLEKDPWSEIEMHLFTIFSLQQMLKARAHQMGFNTKNTATLDPDLVDELTTATLLNNVDKVAELNKKIEESIKEQQSS